MSERATSLAETARRKFWNVGGMIPLPVDPYRIAILNGFEVFEAKTSFDALSFGLAEVKKGSRSIYLNSTGLSCSEKKIEVATVLGAYLLECLDDDSDWGFVNRISSDQRSHSQARQFAIDLLVPRGPFVHDYIASKSLRKMARKYGVSESHVIEQMDNMRLPA